MNKKRGYEKVTQNVYDGRLEKTAIRGIKDLTLIAKKLPEEQLQKIFSEQNVRPFLEAMLSLVPEEIEQLSGKLESKEEREEYFSKRTGWLKSDDFKKRRERVFGYWQLILKEINLDYMSTLVGPENENLIHFLNNPTGRGKLVEVISWLSFFRKL